MPWRPGASPFASRRRGDAGGHLRLAAIERPKIGNCPAWMFVPAAAIRGVLADLARHVPLRSRPRADVRKRRPAKRAKVTNGAKALAAFREVIARKEQARRAKLMVAVTVMRSAIANRRRQGQGCERGA